MLASLLNTIPSNLNYEIILIDDGSTDGTQTWLRSLNSNNIHVICNETNLGYAKSNNKAVKMAKGDILGLLNNDLILLAGWLEPMLEVLCNPAINVGIVGNIQRRVINDSIDHTGIQVSHLAKIEHSHDITNSVFNRTFAVTGACCLLFRPDFRAVGGFDEQFKNGGEDVDLCLKLGKIYKYAYVANTSYVKHHVSLTRDRTSLVNEKNSQLLFSKWRAILLQETKNAWVKLLCLLPEDDAAIPVEFNLKTICYDTPHVASLMLANSMLRREETRWQEILDGSSTPTNKMQIEKTDGFHCGDSHPFAFIHKKAWLTIVKGCPARNIFISGKIMASKVSDQQFLDELEISVDVNGIQEQRWGNLPTGHFNLMVENPVLSGNHSSIISISLSLKTKSNQASMPISLHTCKLVRFSHISIDDQLVLSLNGNS